MAARAISSWQQKVDSQAIYANVGYNFSEDLRVSGGLRYTQDEKNAGIDN